MTNTAAAPSEICEEEAAVMRPFSLKAGTSLSYVAIEGEADLKNNEQRYDVYLSGRAMF